MAAWATDRPIRRRVIGEAKRRAEREGLISVLIPERGRPQELERLIASLVDTFDENFEIIVQGDDDDETWRPSIGGHRIRLLRKPRPPTLGEKLNQLAAEAKGSILWFVANDMVMATPDWAAKFREAAARLPDGIGVLYPRDPTHPGDYTSFWAITRRMYETVGFFAPPWFPYWFVDTWWNEIGTLLDRKVQIDVDLGAPDGRGETVGGRPDLEFWCKFFEDTRPMRVRDAIMLLGGPTHVHNRPLGAQEQAWLQENMPKINNRTQECAAHTAHHLTRAFLDRWGTTEPRTDAGYIEAKAIAQKLQGEIAAQAPRRIRVALSVPSGRSWEANTGCAVAGLSAYSTAAGVDIAMMNVQSSMITHGRNSSVEIALNNNCDYILWIDSDMEFPPDALMRLLGHQKDIVGATYNKRVPPYETLGKLSGPKPDRIDGGLMEALLMPSGMLLVKTDVYRRLSYPWYAEGYRWPGKDGFERWWAMMQEYFGAVPPHSVSTSVQETFFATWMRDNFTLSEFGDDPYLLSEDLFWCRKVRRNGYKIHCDLDLTYQMVHLGVSRVSCLKPAAGIQPIPAPSAQPFAAPVVVQAPDVMPVAAE